MSHRDHGVRFFTEKDRRRARREYHALKDRRKSKDSVPAEEDTDNDNTTEE